MSKKVKFEQLDLLSIFLCVSQTGSLWAFTLVLFVNPCKLAPIFVDSYFDTETATDAAKPNDLL